jgi:hypothetical protein
MGHQAIIYGRIQGDRESSRPKSPSLHEHNAIVLRSLPDRDDDWPFLTRHMFAVAEHPYDQGLYKSQVIHFGASFKDEPEKDRHWDLWLSKFEGLVLKKLSWISATVHVETELRPARVYVYRVDRESLGELQFEVEQFGRGATVGEVRWQRQQFDISQWRPDWLL